MVIKWNWLFIVNRIFSLQLIKSKKVLLLCDSHCTISLENPLLPCTKKFFCFLCCFLRLKIINCIFQCVKTRLSNWQWCSLAYLTCYQDTFEEENENVVHNKEEKNLFFLKIEEKSGRRRKMRKTNSDEKHIQKLSKKVSWKKGVCQKEVLEYLEFFSKIISSSSQLLPFLPPLPFSKKKLWRTKIQANPTFTFLSLKPEARGLTQLFTEKSTMCLYALQLLTETFKMYWEDKGGPI